MHVCQFENMVVLVDQFIGTFIGLEQILVLESLNGIRTGIVSHLDYTTELIGPYLKLKKSVALRTQPSRSSHSTRIVR